MMELVWFSGYNIELELDKLKLSSPQTMKAYLTGLVFFFGVGRREMEEEALCILSSALEQNSYERD